MCARRSSVILLCAFALLVGPACPPARAGTAWTLFTLRDGLLSRTVHCLAPTRSGGLLVGTSGGLNHWDGTRWRQYSAGNGLAQGHITAVAEWDGAIWAGSWGGGLSVLRGDTWQTYRAADSSLPCDWIADLAADGDTLWIATYGGGLARLVGNTWTVYRRASSGLPSDWLACLLPDGDGGVWVGAGDLLPAGRSGLAHLTAAGEWQSVALPATDDNAVTALAWRNAAEGARELWVGTPNGVVRLAATSDAWHTLAADPALSQESITCLVSDEAGHVWVGTADGLLLWEDDQTTRYTVRDGLPHNRISALALDIAGRLWVGTLTAGLAAQGEVTPAQVERLPVVLVHGWRSADSDRLEDSEFWPLATWLREDGFAAYFATGISPENTLYQNAVALQQTIDLALRETGADQVYLIGYSMGGLNVRSYLESTLYRGDVARVFTLGSPHQGEDLWFPFLLWEHIAWSDEPSTLELFPTHMALFNATHSQPEDVPYVLIAGDISGAENLPALFGELTSSDGLVSTWSALGPSSLSVEHRLTGDLHAWATQTLLLDLPSLILPRTTYDAHIRPYLFGVGDVPGTGSSKTASTTYSADNISRSALRTGQLGPGESATLDALPVEAAERTRIYVRWNGAALDMTLRDPAGALHTADDAGYIALDFADFAGYVISDTLPGAWQVTLSSPQTNSASSEYVVYAEWPDSTIHLEADSSPAWAALGQTVTISATLQGPANLVVRAVTAQVYAPSGELYATLPLARATETADGLVYTATLAPPTGGYYSTLITATGCLGEYSFERGAYVNVGVRGDSARLQGDAALNAVQADGQTYLVAEVSVQVRSAGDYSLSATLTRADTQDSVTVAHPLHLTPGTQHVQVPFEQLSLVSGITYRLTHVELFDISDAALPLDEAAPDIAYPAQP